MFYRRVAPGAGFEPARPARGSGSHGRVKPETALEPTALVRSATPAPIILGLNGAFYRFHRRPIFKSSRDMADAAMSAMRSGSGILE